jgi:hypothetical protein
VVVGVGRGGVFTGRQNASRICSGNLNFSPSRFDRSWNASRLIDISFAYFKQLSLQMTNSFASRECWISQQ